MATVLYFLNEKHEKAAEEVNGSSAKQQATPKEVPTWHWLARAGNRGVPGSPTPRTTYSDVKPPPKHKDLTKNLR